MTGILPGSPPPPTPIEDAEEVTDDDVAALESWMPARPAEALRKMIWRSRRIWTAIQGLNQARNAHAARIKALEDWRDSLP